MSGNHLAVSTSTSETPDSSVGLSTTAISVPAKSIRKRGRRDSDSNSKDQRPPSKMYKGEDTDTDNEMDGLMFSSSSSSSPTVTQTQDAGITSVQKQRTYHRDEKYYFEDGSCVLRVADVLFNVSFIMMSSCYLLYLIIQRSIALF